MNRVIEGGHEPRRFATDMLDRFRDLIVLASVPDAISTGLLDVPPDRAEALKGQAERYGLASLTRAADLVATGLDQMRGATSPRLLLELMCAQVLLPAAATDERSLLARLERLEAGAAAAPPACRSPPVQVTSIPNGAAYSPAPPVCRAAARRRPRPARPPAPPAQQPGPAARPGQQRSRRPRAASGARSRERQQPAGATGGRQPRSASAGAAAGPARQPAAQRPRRCRRRAAAPAAPQRPAPAFTHAARRARAPRRRPPPRVAR